MWYTPDNFKAKEKAACVKALIFILNVKGKDNHAKREYIQLQFKAMGIPENKYNLDAAPCSWDTMIKELKNIESLRIQRYIIREMIMLAIADQDISDDEIRNIYQIAETIGISGEKVGDFFIWAAKGIEWRIEGMQLIEEDL
ncbi:MAG: hypothetical protein IJ545_02925 [Alphaproteobacteria bacterium]|nr:hypothetical protein [Alphaproteobacteria bacterium]